MKKKWEVEWVLADGTRNRVGIVVCGPKGYRFTPTLLGRLPSRKRYPTMEACLPIWVGYPDNCEMTEVL